MFETALILGYTEEELQGMSIEGLEQAVSRPPEPMTKAEKTRSEKRIKETVKKEYIAFFSL